MAQIKISESNHIQYIPPVRLFTISAAAKLVGIERGRFRRLVDTRKIKSIVPEPGANRLIPYSAIVEWQKNAIEEEENIINSLLTP